MELVVTLLFIVAVFVTLFVIEYWWVLLILLGAVGLIALIVLAVVQGRVRSVVKARVIGEDPIIERVSEKTGHTTSYGRGLSYHEHYRDRNVITGYNVKFAVEYKNGKRGVITCTKDGGTYSYLILLCE